MPAWALVGSPNSGKTTLYNWLTGAKSKTVNYPGSTVEYNVGNLRPQLAEKIDNADIKIIDTPGIYSLRPQSEDEQVTHDVLFDSKTNEKLSGVIVVLDATQLSRHLPMARQIFHSGYPVIFVMSMFDLVKKEGSEINLEYFKKELNSNIVLFDGILGQGLNEIVQLFKNINTEFSGHHHPEWSIQEQHGVLHWAEALSEKIISKRNHKKSAQAFTYKLDYYLIHPVFGLFFFFIFMSTLFASIYWAAIPIMESLDLLFTKASALASQNISGLAGEFIGSGLINALGSVVIFTPQIFILFLGIGVLESTGYLARVAALMDKPLSLVGLGGRSFVPMLSGFACAIPAIMATRNIASKKEKLIAQCIIPFMTCSARLPVYALLIGFLFGKDHALLAGFIMALTYFIAILIGAMAAKIISKFIIQDSARSSLMMELPLYRRPILGFVVMQSLVKVKSFIFKSGPIIFSLALVLWGSTHFPRTNLLNTEITISESEIAKNSYAAQVGQFIEPIFKPLGVDWRVGFSLISAFAAREVFISSLALMLSSSAEVSDQQNEGLLVKMKQAAFSDGTPVFTTASVVGLFIFFMIALQCMSTVGVLKKEMGLWRPAVLQLLLSNLAAYTLAAVAVNILKFFGF